MSRGGMLVRAGGSAHHRRALSLARRDIRAALILLPERCHQPTFLPHCCAYSAPEFLPICHICLTP